MDTENETQKLKGLKSIVRANAIKEIAFNLHHDLKRLGYKTVDKSFLMGFISADSLRSKQKILKEIVDFLLSKGKITKTDKDKIYSNFENKELFTQDYESYKAIMKKNGYRTHHFKFKHDGFKPVRVCIGVSDVNANDEFMTGQADLIETKSFKPIKQQGVYSNTSLSLMNRKHKKKINAYAIN